MGGERGNIMKKIGVFCVISILLSLLRVDAGDIEKMGIAARTKEGQVIKCSPNGGDDTKTLLDGLKLLKEKMVLHLMPGEYEDSLQSSLDGIIVEGEPGGYCSVDIKLTGKNIIIRNMWCNHASTRGDTVIVDSIIGIFQTSWDNNKAQYSFYNCCLHAVMLGDYNHKVHLRNCTIVQNAKDNFCVSMWYGGYVSVEDSIMYSESRCFRLDGNPELHIENSMVYGALSLAVDDGYSSRTKGTEAVDVKGFKKICRLKTMGEIIMEKPTFAAKSKKSVAEVSTHGAGISWSTERDKDLNIFKLEKGSVGEGKNLGANLNEDGFPVPKTK